MVPFSFWLGQPVQNVVIDGKQRAVFRGPVATAVNVTTFVKKLLCRFPYILQPSRIIYHKSHCCLTCNFFSNLKDTKESISSWCSKRFRAVSEQR